jgi:DUF1680 family protein
MSSPRTESRDQSGPVRVTHQVHTALRPATSARISNGLWHERRTVNREVSIPDGWERLQVAGNLYDLHLAAGEASGEYRNDLPFMDSDLYKWLEAVAWLLTDEDLPQPQRVVLEAHVDQAVRLLAKVQEPDGYLNSFFQVTHPGERFGDLAWGHELYTAGHLLQAAVALHRATGRRDLLEIATRFADLIDSSFGTESGQVDGVDGHPEIEMALVELFRATGEERYLDRAQYFIDRRGHGLLGECRSRDLTFGRQYWQDHLPVRNAVTAEGHAVRQLYLLGGIVDVYAETGEAALLEAAERLWADLVATKTYLTGGVGAHHTDEAIGDPYELPNERAYCETCAAIASVMLSWRLLLATGKARYADLIERTLYNGFLAGMSRDGDQYTYVNPLQVRDGHLARGGDMDSARTPWFRCACCPPNVMRLLASLQHYVVAGNDTDLVIHQYIPGAFTTHTTGGQVGVTVDTDLPWSGTVSVTVTHSPAEAWTLVLRVPHWADSFALSIGNVQLDDRAQEGWLRVTRRWHQGDIVTLALAMPPRLTKSDSRVDATRGCVAIERGPLVYCLEEVDQGGSRLDDVMLDVNARIRMSDEPELLGGVALLRTQGHLRHRTSVPPWWPYLPDSEESPVPEPVELNAIPYFAWGTGG